MHLFGVIIVGHKRKMIEEPFFHDATTKDVPQIPEPL